MNRILNFPLFLLLGLMTLVAASSLPAAVPQLIHYQGRVISDGTNFTGSGGFKFALVSGGMNTNTVARARASVNIAGEVTSIAVLDGGSGYKVAPKVVISDILGNGKNAAAGAIISGGQVVSIQVTDGGTGYNFVRPPSVRLENPPIGIGYITYWSNDGTSTMGDEPSASVSRPVENGLYSVLLGNPNLANMEVIPATVFENDDVRLRVWFDDGATGFQQFSPDQRIAAVGYAMMSAGVEDGAITSAKLADGAVTATKIEDDAVTATKIADGAITQDKIAGGAIGTEQLGSIIDLGATNINGRLNVYGTSAGTPSVSLIGSGSQISTYGSDGQEQIRLYGESWGEAEFRNNLENNRIGAKLSAGGSGGGWMRLYNTNGSQRAYLRGLNSGGALTLYQADGGIGAFLDGDSAGSGLLRLYNTNGSTRINLYGQSPTSDNGGEIGVNDQTGTETIELLGQSSLNVGGKVTLRSDTGVVGAELFGEEFNDNGGSLILRNSDGNIRAEIDGDDGGGGYVRLLTADGGSGVTLDGESSGAGLIAIYNDTGGTRVLIDGLSTGNGGEISVRDTTGTETVQILGAETTTSGGEIKLFQQDGTLSVELDGEAGNGLGGWLRLYSADGSTAITLDADDATGVGRVTTQVLQITGGSDLSEQFDVKSLDQELQPGMVVSIDPNHPGQLMISSQAYDRTAAGVISGAGGVRTGMLMGQNDSVANGQHPVALTGRVYCWVDADQGGAIMPGDLITTSDTPGHGMKVNDHAKAQGAIIGKSMTKLEKGRGLVLVLVSLQ